MEKKLIDDYDEKLRHITNRIYQILDRLIVEYSSLRVKIGEIEKKLERAEGKFDS